MLKIDTLTLSQRNKSRSILQTVEFSHLGSVSGHHEHDQPVLSMPNCPWGGKDEREFMFQDSDFHQHQKALQYEQHL